YTQLIARRVRDLGVYAEVFPFDAAPAQVNQHQPRGYILSGGPNSVYEPGAPQMPRWMVATPPVRDTIYRVPTTQDGGSNTPILGVCYGMQAMTHALGGVVASSQAREYGPANITQTAD